VAPIPGVIGAHIGEQGINRRCVPRRGRQAAQGQVARAIAHGMAVESKVVFRKRARPQRLVGGSAKVGERIQERSVEIEHHGPAGHSFNPLKASASEPNDRPLSGCAGPGAGPVSAGACSASQRAGSVSERRRPSMDLTTTGTSIPSG